MSCVSASASRVGSQCHFPPAPSPPGGNVASARGLSEIRSDDIEDEPDGCFLDEVSKGHLILSVTTKGQHLGAATYDRSTGRLLLLEDAPLTGLHLDMEQHLINRIELDSAVAVPPSQRESSNETEDGGHDVIYRCEFQSDVRKCPESR